MTDFVRACGSQESVEVREHPSQPGVFRTFYEDGAVASVGVLGIRGQVVAAGYMKVLGYIPTEVYPCELDNDDERDA